MSLFRMQGSFIDNLPKIYGFYTGGFIVFVGLMAILESMGLKEDTIGLLFVLVPRVLLGVFAITDGVAFEIAQQLLAYLAVSGLFITVALAYTGGLQGTGDTRSPLYISIVSQVVVPLGLCWYISATPHSARS